MFARKEWATQTANRCKLMNRPENLKAQWERTGRTRPTSSRSRTWRARRHPRRARARSSRRTARAPRSPPSAPSAPPSLRPTSSPSPTRSRCWCWGGCWWASGASAGWRPNRTRSRSVRGPRATRCTGERRWGCGASNGATQTQTQTLRLSAQRDTRFAVYGSLSLHLWGSQRSFCCAEATSWTPPAGDEGVRAPVSDSEAEFCAPKLKAGGGTRAAGEGCAAAREQLRRQKRHTAAPHDSSRQALNGCCAARELRPLQRTRRRARVDWRVIEE